MFEPSQGACVGSRLRRQNQPPASQNQNQPPASQNQPPASQNQPPVSQTDELNLYPEDVQKPPEISPIPQHEQTSNSQTSQSQGQSTRRPKEQELEPLRPYHECMRKCEQPQNRQTRRHEGGRGFAECERKLL